MDWRELLGCAENENLNSKASKPSKPSEKRSFEDIEDIEDKGLKSTLSFNPSSSHDKKEKRPSLPVEVYPDCKGWGISELRAWHRCLECEWAWSVKGVHVCLDQDEKRVDCAMKTCRRVSND